ncbi:MAG: serine hydrolase [Planctomycetota bacterium]
MLTIAAASLLTPTAPAAPREATLAERLASLCQRLDQRREALRIPGMAIAVVKDDQVVLARGFGLRDVEQGLPATEATLFSVGSTTKAFTAMLVAMLADEGKIGLDDPVRKHLPYFHLHDPVADGAVTVRDLLCHRTGITRCGWLSMGNKASREDVLRQLAEAEAYAPFRTRFLYNNEMYLAAGECAAHAAHATWEALVAQRLLQPLGMTSTNLSVTEMQKDGRASKGYKWIAGEQRFEPLPMRTLSVIAPAGAINSNALDMAQWVRFQLNRGVLDGRRLVSDRQFDEMWKSQMVMGSGSSYGLGWMLHERDGHRVVEHGGNIDGFAAEVGLFPGDHVGFVLLSNVTASALQGESVRLVFDALIGEFTAAGRAEAEQSTPGKPLEPSELERYVGTYKLAPAGLELTVAMQDSQLTLEIPGQTTSRLNWPDQRGRWSFQMADQVAVSFRRLENGYVPGLVLHQDGNDIEVPRAKIEPLPTALSIDELMELRAQAHGWDHAAELGAIRMTGTMRFVHQGLSGKVSLVWADTDRYVLACDFGRFGFMNCGTNGEHAWSHSMLDVVERGALPGAEVEALALQHPAAVFGDWRDFYQDVTILGKERVNGEDTLVVRCTRNSGPPVKQFLSTRTHLLVAQDGPQSEVGPSSLGARVYYGDYRPVRGLMLPFRCWRENEATGRITVQYETADANVTVEPSTFGDEPRTGN